MWLFRVVLLAAFLALGLSACSWQPASRLGVSNTIEFSEIQIATIKERDGQILRKRLIDRLTPAGQPNDPKYRLTIKLSDSSETIGLRGEGDVARAILTQRASYTLERLPELEVVFSNKAANKIAYNRVATQYLSEPPVDAARRRGVEALVELIERDLTLFFEREKVERAIDGPAL